MKNIAVFADGDSCDYAVTEDRLAQIVSSGELRSDGRNTGDAYGEAEPRDMYSADTLPMECDGLTILAE